jgi:protein involved in polysaccharide export with SLBB domain
LLLGAVAFAQTATTTPDVQSLVDPTPSLSADRIMRIFREHPDLMEVARNQLEANSPGDNPDTSEAAMQQRLKTNPKLRAQVTATLIERGIVDMDDPELNNAATAAAKMASGGSDSDDDSRTSPDPSMASLSGPIVDAASDVPMKTERVTRNANSNRRDSARESGRPAVRRTTPPYESMPALRDLYAQMVDSQTKLERFGTEIFKNIQNPGSNSDVPAGADYVIGSGDSLRIDMWGSVTRRFTLSVDREGRISIPEVGTVLLSGKTLEQARVDIDQALTHEYRNARSDISLTRIRTVRVYVVGNVAQPGAYEISALSTVLNAVCMAGGPTQDGSMRMVQHRRGDKLLSETDLYDLLLHGIRGETARLEPGDTILVPTIKKQVSIAGAVRHPAIYELKDETDLQQAVELAGGVVVSGSLREIKVERVQAHEQRLLLSVKIPDGGTAENALSAMRGFQVQDGDQVTIGSIAPYSNASVYLDGHVVHPGKFSYREGMKLTDLVGSYRELMPEPADHAEIVRLEQPDWKPKVIDFDLRVALAGKQAILLQPFDTVRIYSRYAFDAPRVTIHGEVLRPGEYPMSDGMTATDLLRLAGGFKRSAFTETADLVSYSLDAQQRADLDTQEVAIGRALRGEADTDVRLKARDVLTIRQIPGWNDIGASITISGEVQYPGTYGITPGEKLSSVIRRAGGFRESAYPHGAVLTRDQVKEIDEQARDALMHRIESANPRIKVPGPDTMALTSAFAVQQQQILKRLREQPVSGRQVIHISPNIAEWENQPGDVELRAGDQLVIPKKPTFVAVQGQVNNPSAITFSPGKKADWYLKRAGGTTEFANTKSMFIVRADGSVIGQNGGFWSGGVSATVMEPGDTVVIPEKIITDNPTWRNLLSTAQMASSLAIAARVATSF